MTQGFSRSPRGSFLPPTIRYGGAGTSSGGPNAALWEYGGYPGGSRNGSGGTGNDASGSTGIRNVPRLKDRVKQWSFDEQGMAGEPGGGA